ncbi:phage tail spike protein [Enorma massiliensis]|uniref:phage tail spike protein n=1 Tax=Enorma massiliensis TaxID=1472761 RepID=UPI001956105E|nr:phage tail spike protein [Enorma massiliensis]
MAGSVPTIFWFDRFDDRIGILPVVGELVHTEELNGEDTIEFECRDVPTKGDRLLWKDGDIWREHVVVRTDEPIEGLCSVYAESSLCELLDDFIEEQHLVSRTARQALAVVLAPTRWSIASCDVARTAGCVLYHVNALWALRRVAEVWDGEIEPVITVVGGRVTSRSIRFRQRLGSWRGLRFTYDKNMAGCTRTVLEQDVYTALYGFGAGLPVTDEDGRYTGGYRKKLTFGEVNGGVNWVGDEDARLVWGRWNAGRTAKVHSFGQVTFSECDDPAKLLALTRKALVDAVQPKVSYEIDVAALDGGECGLGNLSGVRSMRYTFSSCAFATIDFRGFDPSTLTDLFYTFSGCSRLTTILADASWALPTSGITGSQRFYSCSASLVGGNGTAWASNKTAYTYFRIDTASTPGYITVL